MQFLIIITELNRYNWPIIDHLQLFTICLVIEGCSFKKVHPLQLRWKVLLNHRAFSGVVVLITRMVSWFEKDLHHAISGL